MKNIENSIYENQDKIIEVIRKGIQIPSVKGEPQENAPYGENVKRAGWVEIGEGDSMVAILGHLDVVPEGNGWEYEPYGAEVHDEILFGRGVADDKGPTLGAMYALKLIKDAGIPLKKRIRVILVHVRPVWQSTNPALIQKRLT